MTSDSIIFLENASIIQNNNLVLSNINLNVDRGEFIYLIGKVGTGKSSIIRVLNAELPLTDGTGIIAGYDLRKLKKKQIPYLRRKLGIVFQDFQLLNDRSVYENLLFVLKATGWRKKPEIFERINNVLEKVGLSDKLYKMPHQLSGGEQQRIVIARALLNDPLILLADEPTGNLDPETSEGLMELLGAINKSGSTIIMATHNYPLIKKFPSRTLKCENGLVAEYEVNSSTIDFDSLS
jgi:cell division transport system ATP-binding protein